jgi:hypothetical protein
MDVSAVTTLTSAGGGIVYRLTYHKSKLNSLFRRVGVAALRFGPLSDAAVRENVLPSRSQESRSQESEFRIQEFSKP